MDIATVLAVESSFDPKKVGGLGNNYHGLIQWGPWERKHELPKLMSQIGLPRDTNILNVPFEKQIQLFALWVEKRAGERNVTIRDIHSVYRMINPSAYGRGDAFGTKGLNVLGPNSPKRTEALGWLRKEGQNIASGSASPKAPGASVPASPKVANVSPSRPSAPASPKAADVSPSRSSAPASAKVADVSPSRSSAPASPTPLHKVLSQADQGRYSVGVFEKQQGEKGERYIPRGNIVISKDEDENTIKIEEVKPTLGYPLLSRIIQAQDGKENKFYVRLRNESGSNQGLIPIGQIGPIISAVISQVQPQISQVQPQVENDTSKQQDNTPKQQNETQVCRSNPDFGFELG